MDQSIKNLIVAVKTMLRKMFRRSDYTRWKNKDSLHSSWDERTNLIAQLIPSNTSVIEFGAGNMSLKKYIQSTVDYTPTDFVQRDDSHLIYNLNAPQLQPFEKKYDVAVFSGVLEYVNDIPRLISHLSDNSFKNIIASYAINEKNDGLIFRGRSGWVNNYSSNEIINTFRTHNYKCIEKIVWQNQEIYLFAHDNLKDL